MNLNTLLEAQLFETSVLETIGWCLIHSVWQITLIAIVVRVLLATIRDNAQLRYYISLAGLLAVVAAPIATWQFVPSSVGPLTNQSATQSGEAMPEVFYMPVNTISLAGDFATSPEIVNSDHSIQQQLTSLVRPWLAEITIVWLIGFVMFSMRPLTGLRAIHRFKRVGTSSVPEKISLQFEALLLQLGITRPVQLFQSSLATVPMVAGFLKPVVLIPASTFTNLSAAEIEAVLAHELAHLRRFDDIVNLAQTLLETAMFYHPGVWWISAAVRQERENCCDNVAVEVSGSAKPLANALLQLEQSRPVQPMLAVNGGSLVKRIRRLSPNAHIRQQRKPFPAYWIAMCTAILLMAGVVVASTTRPVDANQPGTLATSDVAGEQDPKAEPVQEETEPEAEPEEIIPGETEPLRIKVDNKSGSLVVSGDLQDIDQVETIIRNLLVERESAEAAVLVLPLTNQDANTMLDILKRVTQIGPIKDAGIEVPQISVDFRTNSIILCGSPDSLELFKELINRLGVETQGEIVPEPVLQNEESDSPLFSVEPADLGGENTNPVSGIASSDHERIHQRLKELCDEYGIEIRDNDVMDEIRSTADTFGLTQRKYLRLLIDNSNLSVDHLMEGFWTKIAARRLSELGVQEILDPDFPVQVTQAEPTQRVFGVPGVVLPEVKVIPVIEISLFPGSKHTEYTSFSISSLVVDQPGLVTVQPGHQREFQITADNPGTCWIEAFDGENRLAARFRVKILTDLEILDRGVSGYVALEHRKIVEISGHDPKSALHMLSDLMAKVDRMASGREEERLTKLLSDESQKIQVAMEMEAIRKSMEESIGDSTGPEPIVEELNVELHVGESKRLTFNHTVPELMVSNPEVVSVTPVSPDTITVNATENGVSWVEISDENHEISTRIRVRVVPTYIQPEIRILNDDPER